MNPNGTTAEATAPGGSTNNYSYRELLDLRLPPERPLVSGLIGENSANIWGAPPYTGKTWLVLATLRAIASGTLFAGYFETVQASVLLVDEESNLRGLVDRLQAMERADPLGRDLPLHVVIGNGIRVDDGDGLQRLGGLIHEYRPKLVVGDSLTRLHGANENSAGEMAAVFDNLKRLMWGYDCSVLLTDHVRKRGLINDPEERLRGSIEKRAWPDAVLDIDADPDDRSALVVTTTKSRYQKRLDPFRLRLDIDSDAGTAAVSYLGEAVSPSKVTRGNEIIVAIHEVIAQAGPDAADASTLAAWLNVTPKTVRKHADALVKAGLITTCAVRSGASGGPAKTTYLVKEPV